VETQLEFKSSNIPVAKNNTSSSNWLAYFSTFDSIKILTLNAVKENHCGTFLMWTSLSGIGDHNTWIMLKNSQTSSL